MSDLFGYEFDRLVFGLEYVDFWFDLFDLIWFGFIWFDLVWFGLVWFDLVYLIWFSLV
jgi:hypothetical protein